MPTHSLPRQVSLLEDDGEDGVRARRLGVHLRPTRRATDAPVLQQTHHLFERARLLLANAAHHDGAVGALPNRDGFRGGVRVQQVANLLVVHLEERASHGDFGRALASLDAREDVGDDAGMMPTSSSRRLEEFPLPMVYVLPLPVWPYARTVAL